ncbi:MAG TPA: c-type cytochrome [Burkholderiales bacterium]|nr:c-type cytochrome [Burkholderiales bacterium]
MPDAHIEEHNSFIKTPNQLILVMVLAFAIPVIGIIGIASYMTGGMKVEKASNSDAAVAERLKPVGSLVIGEPPAQPQAASAAPGVKTATGQPVKTAAGGASAGKQLYDTVCTACHGAGIAGAPKAGDKAAWGPRIAKGKDSLYNSALHGKNAMPPKGGSQAPDADVKAAVDYMVGMAK